MDFRFRAEPIKEQNQLLGLSSENDWEKIRTNLYPVELASNQILYEPGLKMDCVYFPTTSIVSLVYELENGSSAEIALVGKEGLVGVSVFTGGGYTSSSAIVQSAGMAYKIRSGVILEIFNNSHQLMNIYLRYIQALITQMSLTAVCNRHHTVEKQLCRWLLLSADRLPDKELLMTQCFIANMLGVRREGVTDAARKLQKAGIIRYSRGRITIVDRERLEDRSCECYQVVKNEYDRLLPSHLTPKFRSGAPW